MKTMTCKQLGGACDLAFSAETFEEIAVLSKNHGAEMFKNNDEAHLEAMNAMQAMMTSKDTMKEWFDARRQEFDALPHQ